MAASQVKGVEDRMKELVEYVARAIVNEPDQVSVTDETGPDGIVLQLQVAPDDKGRVIGKQGRVAQSLRTILRVMATRAGTKAKLEIL